jgi:cobalt-zinc-cadmium efflux system outer membrane protein
MSHNLRACVLAVLLVMAAPTAISASEVLPGASLGPMLELAKTNNPEYASMRFERQAAAERVTSAGALPDPKLRAELMDITKGDTRTATIWPNDVGSTRYTLMQDLPWFGKRDLKRDMAAFEANAVTGKVNATWSDLATRIKTLHALRYYHHGNQELVRDMLVLMVRLEKVTQVRYANGLAAQQDVIRAQIEQTNVRMELAALENEGAQMDARLNALLGRPADAPLADPVGWRALPPADKLEVLALQERLRASNPALFEQASRIRVAEAALELAYKNRYPDFNVGLALTQYPGATVPSGNAQHNPGAMMAPPATGNEWAVMLELNIPLQQASRRAQERESEAMLLAARARQDALANQLLAELADNVAGINAAGKTGLLVATSLLPHAELTFSAALVAYENGKVDFATLLDAQRQIRQAKQSQLKSGFETQVRIAEIEKLLGEDL